MTTRQAEAKFKITQSQIRNLCKEHLIPNSRKIKNEWDIPDDLNVILFKEDIVLVLIKILELKNYGDSYPINRSVFPTREKYEYVMDYLYRLGMIGEYNNRNQELKDIQLTEEGFHTLFGGNLMKTNAHCTSDFHFALAENVSVQVGVGNIQSSKLATVG